MSEPGPGAVSPIGRSHGRMTTRKDTDARHYPHTHGTHTEEGS